MNRRSVIKALAGLPIISLLPKTFSEPTPEYSVYETFEERHFVVGRENEKWTMLIYGFGITFKR